MMIKVLFLLTLTLNETTNERCNLKAKFTKNMIEH